MKLYFFELAKETPGPDEDVDQLNFSLSRQQMQEMVKRMSGDLALMEENKTMEITLPGKMSVK